MVCHIKLVTNRTEVTQLRKWLSFLHTPSVPLMRIFTYKITN